MATFLPEAQLKGLARLPPLKIPTPASAGAVTPPTAQRPGGPSCPVQRQPCLERPSPRRPDQGDGSDRGDRGQWGCPRVDGAVHPSTLPHGQTGCPELRLDCRGSVYSLTRETQTFWVDPGRASALQSQPKRLGTRGGSGCPGASRGQSRHCCFGRPRRCCKVLRSLITASVLRTHRI